MKCMGDAQLQRPSLHKLGCVSLPFRPLAGSKSPTGYHVESARASHEDTEERGEWNAIALSTSDCRRDQEGRCPEIGAPGELPCVFHARIPKIYGVVHVNIMVVFLSHLLSLGL